MGKLDKKALKILKTKQYIDVDAGDIAVALRCDDDSVQESLNSLKDQGLIENFSRDGKTFWRVYSDEPHQQAIEAKAAIEHEGINLGDTKAFFLNLEPEQPSQASEKPINPEPQIKPHEKTTSETEEFFIDLKPLEPSQALKMPIESVPETNHREKTTSETGEFFIDLKPLEPSQALKKPISPEPIVKSQKKNSSDTEEFYINLLSEKPVKELEKTTDPKPQMKRQEKKHSETEEFYIHLLSEDSKATHDQILDDNDQARDWNMRELIFKAKIANNGKFKKETFDKMDEDVSIKRSSSPIMWVITSIMVSVLISCSMSMLMTMNVNKTAQEGIQALNATVKEISAKQDQRIEVLSKKLNTLLEKNQSFTKTYKRKR
jgi:hypothetical protein